MILNSKGTPRYVEVTISQMRDVVRDYNATLTKEKKPLLAEQNFCNTTKWVMQEHGQELIIAKQIDHKRSSQCVVLADTALVYIPGYVLPGRAAA